MTTTPRTIKAPPIIPPAKLATKGHCSKISVIFSASIISAHFPNPFLSNC